MTRAHAEVKNRVYSLGATRRGRMEALRVEIVTGNVVVTERRHPRESLVQRRPPAAIGERVAPRVQSVKFSVTALSQEPEFAVETVLRHIEGLETLRAANGV